MREFIVEADGGSRGNPGPAGYGAVVSDGATGETLAEAAEYLGVATNNVAEYRGLLAGLRAAHALDPGARVHVSATVTDPWTAHAASTTTSEALGAPN